MVSMGETIHEQYIHLMCSYIFRSCLSLGLSMRFRRLVYHKLLIHSFIGVVYEVIGGDWRFTPLLA